MKCLIFGDVHWSTNSSLVRGRGKVYSKRLELLIDSLNWVEQLGVDNHCDIEVCLGDFCDKSTLVDEEITALTALKWNNIKKYFIVGNHESTSNNLEFSSVQAVSGNNITIISQPEKIEVSNSLDYYFLPYMVETNRPPLKQALNDLGGNKKHKVVFSHNDIAGIQYGAFTSKLGFSLDEIIDNCALYINGHLHNSEMFKNKVLNAGSLSAHNFTNDSAKYQYGAWILDTDTFKLTFFENPYSLNFYKLEVNTKNDLKLQLKNNSVLSIKCKEKLLDTTKAYLKANADKILETRLTVLPEVLDNNEVSIQELQVNHLDKFITFCKQTISNTDILEAELAEICK